MSNALRAQGTKIQHGIGLVFSDVEESTDIKLGGVSITSIENTHLQSIAKEFMPGLTDNTNVDVVCNFTNGTIQNAMRADSNVGTISAYKILINSGAAATPAVTTIAFSGFITKIAGPDAKVDGKLEIQMTIKVTGALTITTV